MAKKYEQRKAGPELAAGGGPLAPDHTPPAARQPQISDNGEALASPSARLPTSATPAPAPVEPAQQIRPPTAKLPAQMVPEDPADSRSAWQTKQVEAEPAGAKSTTTTTTRLGPLGKPAEFQEIHCDRNSSRQVCETDRPPEWAAKKSCPEEQQQQQQAAGAASSPPPRTIGENFFTDKTARVDNLEDENNQILPVWPSRITEANALRPAEIQHQVYSLKDYSQVSGPAAPVTGPPAASSAAGRLLKSMSQDRKVKASAKRMSECIYPSGQAALLARETGANALGASGKPRTPSVIDKISSASFSMGPATSVNSLLPPSLVATKNTALLSESRIDRVRKLFVRPLSLRTGGGGAGGGSGGATGKGALLGAANPALANPRLSFQSGASVLHKPHHLMHAVYRTRAHHSRRSPMRQKQGAAGAGAGAKGFRVYGCPLHMANNIYPITCFGRPDIYKQQSVPYILARLCNYIEENSSQLTHEGIFRVSGNARLMEKLRTLFDRLGDAPLESESVDVATSASMLKMYLRELPEPLIPTRMNYHFIALAKKYSSLLSKDNMSDFKAFDSAINQPASSKSSCEASLISLDNHSALDKQRAAYLRDLTKLVRKLPIENYNLLKYLACFLYRISLKQQYNKMCAEALGIVFGPNVFRIRSESYKGLKEQELSNQIMASIIINYKSIFDCELTDPLGNLIKSTEELISVSPSQQAHSEPHHHLASGSARVTDDQKRSRADHQGAASSRAAGSSPKPSTSSDFRCCKATCGAGRAAAGEYHYRHRHANEALDHADERVCPLAHYINDYDENGDNDDDDDDDDVDDDDGDDDDDDEEDEDDDNYEDELDSEVSESDDEAGRDDDDCDDESYSPTSSSSYCSSMDTGSIESTYDEDGAPADSNHRAPTGHHRDANNPHLSSECASDTNYTPSSSHTDSDFLNESARYESSTTDSSPLRQARAGAAESRASAEVAGKQQQSCRVCKRRESAQIESLARRLTIAHQAAQPRRTSIPVVTSEQPPVAGGESRGETGAKERPTLEAATGGASGRAAYHRASRRKRSDESRRPTAAGKRDTCDPEATTSSDQTLDRKQALDGELRAAQATARHRLEERLERASHQPARAGAHPLARRRSSSASSLNRLRIKSAKRNAAAAAAAGNQQRHYRIRSSHSERCKGSMRGYAAERKSTNKSASRSSRRSQNQAGRAIGPRRNRRQGQSPPAPPPPLATDPLDESRLMANDDDSLVFDLVSASYLQIPTSVSLFHMRPYNSDETLLRVSEQYGENPDDELEHRLRSQRRFSNLENFPTTSQQHNVVIPIYQEPHFDRIFEAVEGEATILDQPDDSSPTDSALQRTKRDEIETSIISILGEHRMSSAFNHSENSVVEFTNDQNVLDPIFIQLKVMRSLILILERLLNKSKKAAPADHELIGRVVGVLEQCDCPPASSAKHSVSICSIDYLTAEEVIATLEDLIASCAANQSTSSSSSSSSRQTGEWRRLDHLAEYLRTRVDSLKDRYNSLKVIRDHFIKFHAIKRGGQYKSHLHDETAKSMQRREGLHRSLDDLSGGNKARTASLNIESKHRASERTRSNGTEHADDGDELLADCPSYSCSTEQVGAPSAGSFSIKLSDFEVEATEPKNQQHNSGASGTSCRFSGLLCPVEFVFNIEKQLAQKKIIGMRLVKLDEMSVEQLRCEKVDLQKNLLRYEHWFGRPASKLEFHLVGHLYGRYHAVKTIKRRKQE